LAYLPDAIASIEAQTMAPREKWLLCDSCEAPALPAGWRIVRGDWHYVSGGRNEALQQTTADWITWLDADDAFAPDHLARVQVEIDSAGPAVGVLYPDLDYYTADWSARRGELRFPAWDRFALLSGNFVPTPSTWRVQMLRDLGGWPAGPWQLDDWAMAMRGARASWTGRHVIGTPVRVRLHHGSMTRTGDTRPERWWQTRRLTVVTLFSGISELLPRWVEWVRGADLPPGTTVVAGDNSNDPAFSLQLRNALAGMASVDTLYIRVPGGMDMERGVSGPHSRVPGLYNAIIPQACDLGDLVLMLEDDVLPPLDAVRTLAGCFVTSDPSGRIGGVAGLYEGRGARGVLAVSRDPYNWRGGVTAADIKPGLQPIGQIPGGCSLFDSRALRSCLPFRWTVDPNGERVGWDGNACRHLQQTGWRLCYHGGVRCEHHVSSHRYSGQRVITRLPAPFVDRNTRAGVVRHPVVRLTPNKRPPQQ
jgi:hypothetical protein